MISALMTMIVALSTFLQVVVIYDPEHDGNPKGVGQHRIVELRKGDALITYDTTNQNSTAVFVVEDPGQYKLVAYVPSTAPFRQWRCERLVNIEADENQTVIIECVEEWVFRIPFILVPPLAEQE